MIDETQHNSLEQLGEELLQEFDETRRIPISFEFDRNARKTIGYKPQSPIRRAAYWTLRTVVLAFALIGVLTVATLSIDSLRTPVLKLAAAQVAPDWEPYSEPEEIAEFKQISHAVSGNTVLIVFYDGVDQYQILVANEYGQQRYDFQSTSLDETSILALGHQLIATDDWTFAY